MTGPQVVIVLGTRPEIIKLSPVIEACERRDVSYELVHTGQHYSENLDKIFFERLQLPAPDYELNVGSESHGRQTGRMIEAIEEVLLDETPEVVLVQGDTNSVLAGAIATSKLDAELGHVEAGLRSYDREMPEETNRVLADHASDYLFAPTETAADNLRGGGISDDRIFVTGNTIVDAVEKHDDVIWDGIPDIQGSSVSAGEYILMTAHRAENVDSESRLGSIFDGVKRAGEAHSLPVVYPVHPRTRNQLKTYDITVPDRIDLIDPLGFFDFLALEANAEVVVTDSGGVQEESCILGTPCVTVRELTERPETLSVGANELAGADAQQILRTTQRMVDSDCEWQNPFGDGTAAERILDVITAE